MRKRWFLSKDHLTNILFAFFICSIIFAAQTATAQNLVVNPDIEDVQNENIWGVKGWSPVHGKPACKLGQEQSHSGKYSLKLKKTTPDQKGYWGMSEALPVKEGEKYKVGGWMKTQGVIPGERSWYTARICWALYNEDGNRCDWGDIARVNGTTDWTYFEKTITIPDKPRKFENVPVAELRLTANLTRAVGTAWFDDFIIEKVVERSKNYPAQKKPDSVSISINGSLDDWPQKEGIPMEDSDKIVIADLPWQGPDDLSGELFLLWDEENFYVGCKVKDNRHAQPYQDTSIWRGDSIQIAIDPLNDTKKAEYKKKAYDTNDMEFGFACAADKPLMQVWRLPTQVEKAAPSNPLSQYIKKETDYAVRVQGDEQIYEIKFPWQSLWPINPYKTPEFRFNLLINDNDGAGRKCWVHLTRGIGQKKDPSVYNKVTLLDVDQPPEFNYLVYPVKKFYKPGEPVENRVICLSNDKKDVWLERVIFSQVQGLLTEQRRKIVSDREVQEYIFKWEPSGENPPGRYESRFVARENGSKPIKRTAVYWLKEDGEKKKTAEVSQKRIKNLQRKIDQLKDEQNTIKAFLEQAKSKGIQLTYQNLAYSVLKRFIPFIQDDIANEDYQLASEKILYLQSLVRETKRECEHLLNNPQEIKDVPVYDMSKPMTIKEGYFYIDGNPVPLIGPCSWDDGIRNIPHMRRLGFNMIHWHIYGGPKTLPEEPGKGAENNALLRQARQRAEVFDRCLKANIKANFMVPHHKFPSWAFRKYPGLDSSTGHMTPFNISHPGAKKVLQRYDKTVIPVVSEHPAVASYVIANEPSFNGRDKYAMAQFRDWLGEKYTTIDRLNAVWDKDLKNFSQIGTKDLYSNPSLYDWSIFNYERNLDFYKWRRQSIRRFDKTTPLHIKVMSTAFKGRDVGQGMHREKLALMNEINGYDGGTPYPDSGRYIMKFISGQVMLLDLLKSFAPEKVIYNSEWHSFFPAENDRYIQASMWQAFFHGMGAGNIWRWGPPELFQKSGGRSGIIQRNPEVLYRIGKTSLDVRRLIEKIKPFADQKRDIALMYSIPSKIFHPVQYLENTRKIYTAFFFLNLPVNFITPRLIKDGKMEEYNLVVFPEVRNIKTETYNRILKYVKDGGQILVMGNSFVRDQYNKKRKANGFLKKVTGNHSGFDQFDLGKGTVFVVSPGGESQKYAEQLQSVLPGLNIRPLVQAHDLDGRPAWGVECRSVQSEGKLYIYLINLNKTQTGVQLRMENESDQFVDLISGEDYTKNISLRPADVLLLQEKQK